MSPILTMQIDLKIFGARISQITAATAATATSATKYISMKTDSNGRKL
jgi:hypothetical protein